MQMEQLDFNYIKKFNSIKDFEIGVLKQVKEETLFNPLLAYNNILSFIV